MTKARQLLSPKHRELIGSLSGRALRIPDVDVPPMPLLAPPGVIVNGEKAEGFGEIDASPGVPGCAELPPEVRPPDPGDQHEHGA